MPRSRSSHGGRRPGRAVGDTAPLGGVEPIEAPSGVVIYEPDNPGQGDDNDPTPSDNPGPESGDLGNLHGRVVAVFGPDLSENGQFEENADNWEAGPAAVALWRFGSTTESWVGTSSTLAQTPDVYPLGDEAGSLAVTATATSYGAGSPTGLSGKPVTVGDTYYGALLVASDNDVPVVAQIYWFTSGGAYISASSGVSQTLEIGKWTPLIVSAVAPATAAYASVGFYASSATITDVTYVSVAALTSNAVSTITRTTTAGEFLSGVGALRVTAPSAGVALASTPAGTVEVNGGETLMVQYMYRQDDLLPGGIALYFYDDDDAFIGISVRGFSSAPNGISTWQMCAHHLQVPVAARSMKVFVGFEATGATQYMYVDEFFIRRTSMVTASVVRTSDVGPRVELANTPGGGHVTIHTSGRAEDEPAGIYAKNGDLFLQAPGFPGLVGAPVARLRVNCNGYSGGLLEFLGEVRLGPRLLQNFEYADTMGAAGGTCEKATSASDVTAVGGTETDILSISNVKFDASREYEVRFACDRVNGPTTGDFTLRLKVGSTTIHAKYFPSMAAATQADAWFPYSPSVDATETVKVTLQRASGSGTADVKANLALVVADVGVGL